MRDINTVDIYCQVIDNYGDAGVCWRLARSLALCGLTVTLWIDDLTRLGALRSDLRIERPMQTLDGFTVRQWDGRAVGHMPADMVIEAFGCRMPEDQLRAMALLARPPVWINLEYLSAESWVDHHHGLPSPHPSLPLTRYFFFPGFGLQSGGLIREPNLLVERRHFDAAARHAFLARVGVVLRTDEILMSVFSYPSAPVAELPAALREGPPVFCVFPGARDDVQHLSQGTFRAQALPLLDPDDYDRLLWSCDLNFVRGEDSAVRAQWAGQPFIWQLYEQAGNVHHIKRDAFFSGYAQGLDDGLATLIRRSWQRWNGESGGPADWSGLVRALPDWAVHARAWSEVLGHQSDLASRLLGFARKIR